MKNTIYIIISVLVIGFIAWFGLSKKDSQESIDDSKILSFVDCVNSGYPIMESFPRQCKTKDGRTFAEEITTATTTYTNSSANLIKVELPFPGAVVGKEFSVIGEARGYWFFEASFPIEILDKDGKILTTGIAQAQGEWMTENFVPFKADIKVPQSYTGEAMIVLKKDNPSGLPENEASASFPIKIEY